jgi:hypothetical protein
LYLAAVFAQLRGNPGQAKDFIDFFFGGAKYLAGTILFQK